MVSALPRGPRDSFGPSSGKVLLQSTVRDRSWAQKPALVQGAIGAGRRNLPSTGMGISGCEPEG